MQDITTSARNAEYRTHYIGSPEWQARTAADRAQVLSAELAVARQEAAAAAGLLHLMQALEYRDYAEIIQATPDAGEVMDERTWMLAVGQAKSLSRVAVSELARLAEESIAVAVEIAEQ